MNELNKLAEALNVNPKSLANHAFKEDRSIFYKQHKKLKRSGKIRTINAPKRSLKLIQEKIKSFLEPSYKPKKCVHGIKGTSIITNAKPHIKQKIVIEIDLKDFYDQITSKRVFGSLKSPPFNYDNKTASLITNLCTLNNRLPQGSPASPILSNIICRKMDGDIIKFCQRHKLTYTRYCDNITISGKTDKLLDKKVRKKIKEIIEIKNDFKINDKKLKIMPNTTTQEVTGLRTNVKLNVKREFIGDIRAMLHNWKKLGYKRCQRNLDQLYTNSKKESFYKKLMGRISYLGSVRGFTDTYYTKYAKEFNELANKNNLNARLKISTSNREHSNKKYSLERFLAKCSRINSVPNLINIEIEGCYIEFDACAGFKHVFEMVSTDPLKNSPKMHLFKNPNKKAVITNASKFRDKNLYQLKVRNKKLVKSDNITFSEPKEIEKDKKYRRYFDLKLGLNLEEFICHNAGKKKGYSLNVNNKPSQIQFDGMSVSEKSEWLIKYLKTIVKETNLLFSGATENSDEINYKIDCHKMKLSI